MSEFSKPEWVNRNKLRRLIQSLMFVLAGVLGWTGAFLYHFWELGSGKRRVLTMGIITALIGLAVTAGVWWAWK